MKIHQAAYVQSAPSLAEAPDLGGVPEFALVGRSNVGKSSFINRVLSRRNLARTSNTPGKTRMLNFYLVDERWAFVDLPGYGYAKVSKEEKKSWQKNLEEFLLMREPLTHVFQMVDSRHGPQANDLEMMAWLRHHDLGFTVVMTKADKVKKSHLKTKVDQSARLLGVDPGRLLLFSAETGLGRDQAVDLIASCLG